MNTKPASLLKLRDYQLECVDSVFHEWEEVTSTLAVCPTGGGKTCIAAEVIRRIYPARAMFICHREELVWQARDKITRFTGLECGIEMADKYVNNSLFGEIPVIVATVQTLNSKLGDRTRMSRFKPDEFGVLICDEVHHGVSKSWQNVMNYMRQNPKLKVLGITATPDRADEEALGQIMETVAFDYEILDAIHSGWLVPIVQQFVSVAGLDFSHIRTTAGDLNGGDLSAVMETEENMQGVCGATIELIGNKRAIVFTCSVHQANQGCEIFNRHKPGSAAWVCGETNKDDRREMLAQFRDGKLQVVFNCGVLTEGYDDSGVEVIVMARPTKSRSLYAQMAGRGTRPLDGLVDGLDGRDARKAAIASSAKPLCTILDFIGNSGRHKLMSCADILGGKVSDAAISSALKKAKESGAPVRMDELLDEEQENINALMEKRRKEEEARRSRLVARVNYSKKMINPFDVFEIAPVKERGWDQGRALSEKQNKLLLSQGVNPDTMSYAEGKAVIGELFRRFEHKLCTVKQASCLKRFGYDTKDMPFKKASELITQLKGSGWKRINQPVAEAVVSSGPPDDEPSPF